MKSQEYVLYNGKIFTADEKKSFVTAVHIKDGKFFKVGNDAEVLQGASDDVTKIDLKKSTAIPGLNDSHTHLIRGGLSYNMELRWEGVPSLADAMEMLKQQVAKTPSPQWVRVVGGWSEFQFKERRLPTLKEINEIAPDTPVFILHLYDRALLNAAALRAVGYTKNTPEPTGGRIERDIDGNPTGLIIATPNASILYATLAKAPKLSLEHQVNSTRHFMKELNRLGVTSVVDAGGGGQAYPDDYKVIEQLDSEDLLTVRIAYNLFTQNPKKEYEDFETWVKNVPLHKGNDMYRHNGGGEMLVYTSADFEDFLQPRPDLPDTMEAELEKVVRLLVSNRWPFRIHATYDESISRFLNVFEKVNRDIPFEGLNWIIDHAETVTEKNIERIKALGGGIAVQHRIAFQGEYFLERYGKEALQQSPPIGKIIENGVPIGAGTDATRVASYNPWIGIYWLSTGKTVGGLQMYENDNILSREKAVELYTKGSAWFSSEAGKKGSIVEGQLGDIVVLTKDLFNVPDEEIKSIESVLTIVNGKIVYAKDQFSSMAPPTIPVLPDWSPNNTYNGAYPGLNNYGSKLADIRAKNAATKAMNMMAIANQIHSCMGSCHVHGHNHNFARLSNIPVNNYQAFWGTIGCSCFAF